MKTSRVIFPILTLSLFFLLLLSSFSPSRAQADESPDLDRPYTMRLALVGVSSQYSVSGKVTNEAGSPLQGVVVTADNGSSTTTDSKGNYQLNGLWTGLNALSPSSSSYLFSPSLQEVNLTANTGGINFTGASVSELIVNGGFENNNGWVIPTTEYKAGYSTTQHHKGQRSMRTGIVDAAQNKYSYSSTSQTLTIPGGAASARLYLWLYPQTSEPSTSSLSDAPQSGDAFPSDRPDFSEAVESSDAQYVLILDENGDVLETLVWMRSNNRTWTQHQFNLVKWAGRKIMVHFGTYNNGGDGVTSLYIDDVALQVTSGSTPPPPTCANALSNSGFESNSAWNIVNTAWPAGYSTLQAKYGSRSMRTGIVDASQNRYSYSDAWQYASIPSNAVNARLKLWYFPVSKEVAGSALGTTEGVPPPLPSATTLTDFYQTEATDDAQYILVLDTNGNILQTLLWMKSNANKWVYTEVDLIQYKGKTIRLQFGTQNDGSDGVTSMYVDEMYVDWCSGTPSEPPTTCTNMIVNGGFENDKAWILPLTEYSAGYSTFIYRSGARAMRTGIYYQSHNRFSYSDARQAVALPQSISKANLSFYINARSSDDSDDVQYVLLLDQWGNWIDTLVWQLRNSGAWVYKEFNLKSYAGETIQVNFGTYNDGLGGVTSMYVDDVKLEVCP